MFDGILISLYVNLINTKGSLFSKFSNKCCTTPHLRILFLFIIILHINDIIHHFWRYRNKPKCRPRLFEQVYLLSLELK